MYTQRHVIALLTANLALHSLSITTVSSGQSFVVNCWHGSKAYVTPSVPPMSGKLNKMNIANSSLLLHIPFNVNKCNSNNVVFHSLGTVYAAERFQVDFIIVVKVTFTWSCLLARPLWVSSCTK